MRKTLPARLAAIGLATVLAVSNTATIAFADDGTVGPVGATSTPVDSAPPPAPASFTEPAAAVPDAQPEPSVESAAPVAQSPAAPTSTAAEPAPVEALPALPGEIPTAAEGDTSRVAANPVDTTPGEFTLISPRSGQIIGSGVWFTVEFACADPESGVESCTLRDHRGSVIAQGESISLPDGIFTWTGEAVNGAGLKRTQSFSFIVGDDIEAPAVTTSWVEPASGWTNKDMIMVSATDDVSGVAAIYVSIDGGTPVAYGTTGPGLPLTVIVELRPGEQAIEYWAVDRIGKSSPRNTATVRYDATLPSIDVAEFGTWNGDLERTEVVLGSDVKLSFECTDDVSGIDYCGLPQAISQTLDTSVLGDHTVSLQARDLAQNVDTMVIPYTVVEAPTEPTTPEIPVDPSAPQQPAAPTTSDGAVRGNATNVSAQLATTGAESGWAALAGGLLLILGSGALLVRRLRKP